MSLCRRLFVVVFMIQCSNSKQMHGSVSLKRLELDERESCLSLNFTGFTTLSCYCFNKVCFDKEASKNNLNVQRVQNHGRKPAAKKVLSHQIKPSDRFRFRKENILYRKVPEGLLDDADAVTCSCRQKERFPLRPG